MTHFKGYEQQVSLKKGLYDLKNRESIAYGTIQIIGTKKITDCDQNGHFEILAEKTDSIMFSCIGYATLIMPISQIINVDSIFLKETFFELENVVVRNSSSLLFGIINEKQERSHVGSNTEQSDRYEMTTFIDIPFSVKAFRISKVFIKEKYFNNYAPFQLHIYSVNAQGFPDSELLKNQIIVTSKNNNEDRIEIDVKNQNIILEGVSFFVGIQWMTCNKEPLAKGMDYGIAETLKLDKPLTYRRSLLLENYRWFVEYEKCIVFPETINEAKKTFFWKNQNTSYGHPINMIASAEIQKL